MEPFGHSVMALRAKPVPDLHARASRIAAA
jgi:hypothetical protein